VWPEGISGLGYCVDGVLSSDKHHAAGASAAAKMRMRNLTTVLFGTAVTKIGLGKGFDAKVAAQSVS
jgi:hypothetical protein